MFQKIADSWELVKASAGVLNQDRELLVLPVLSFLATLVVAASFMLPVLSFKQALAANQIPPELYVLGFLFYFVQYFVIFFFNAALVGAAQMRFRDEDPTLGDALACARGVVIPLLGYAAIAATVGVILRAVAERSGFLGRLVVGLMGIGWTLATFLVVPVLVHEQVGPVEAIKQSTGLLKRTWGENIAGTVGIGTVFGVASVLVLFVTLALFMVLVPVSKFLAIVVAVLAVVSLLGMAVYQAALTGIYQAALHRYATIGTLPPGFNQDLVDNAFFAK
jgi:hypothetical protein